MYKFSLLADNLYVAPIIARWYFEEWCQDSGRYALEDIQNSVAAATNRNSAPMIVLCYVEEELVGAAELKIREMDAFPQYEYWLGGVYVVEEYRGQGIASGLVKEVLKYAKHANIDKLYLQTEDLTGGLYTKFGFKHLHQVDSKGVRVTVMGAELV